MLSNKISLVALFISISILFLSQVAYADSQSATPTVQLPNASNTDQQCVVLARSVLEQNQTEQIKSKSCAAIPLGEIAEVFGLEHICIEASETPTADNLKLRCVKNATVCRAPGAVRRLG